MFYPTISSFFEAEGDFQENIDRETYLELVDEVIDSIFED